MLKLFFVFITAICLIAPPNSDAQTILYSDDFELGFGNWSNVTSGDNNDWTRYLGDTPSSSTGPASGADGSFNHVYLETSAGSAYYAGDTAILLGPVVSDPNIFLTFQYHMYGSDMGILAVDVLEGGTWMNDVWSISGQQHLSDIAAYTAVDVDLSAYACSQVRFRATAAGGYMGDMAIDNVEIKAGGSAAHMIVPTPDTELPGTSVIFEWTAAGADSYWLSVGTMGPGSIDVYDGDPGLDLSTIVSGLPHNGETVYVSLSSDFGTEQLRNDYTFTACTAAIPPAVMLTPAPGSVLPGTRGIFEWTDAGADNYSLTVGTGGPGSVNIYNGVVLDSFRALEGLPHSGETVYVRLSSYVSGQWFDNDYVYAACATQPAELRFPDPDAMLYGGIDTVIFEWTDVQADGYHLAVGTSGPQSNDIYEGAQGTKIATNVSGMPHDAEIVYVSLWSDFGAEQLRNDYVFTSYPTSYPAPAVTITPASGSVLPGTNVTFEWSDVGAGNYDIMMSTNGPGGSDLYEHLVIGHSLLVTGLPFGGETIYVTLGLSMNDHYQYQYVYTASGRRAAELTWPWPVYESYGSSMVFTWTDVQADGYHLSLGTTGPVSNDIYDGDQGGNLVANVIGLPTNGETVYVTLWSDFGAEQLRNEYVFTACTASEGTAPAVMQTPAPGSVLKGTSVMFEWSDVGAYFYDISVGTNGPRSSNLCSDFVENGHSNVVAGLPNNGETLYVTLRAEVPGQSFENEYIYTAYTGATLPAEMQTPVPGATLGSTTETLTWNDTGADQYWLYVGTTGAGSYDVYSGSQGTSTSRSMAGLPNNGETVYVRLFSVIDGNWYRNDHTYVACTGDPGPVAADMQSPLEGSTLTATTEIFTWNDCGAEEYWLYVGTTGTGSYDVYAGNQGTNTSKSVTGLPNNGETVYVRLFSIIGGYSYRNDYTYTAYTGDPGPVAAEMQSPIPGSTFDGTTEIFTWNDCGAELYWLYVGTTGTGSYDVYNGKQGTNTEKSVNGLPNNGETVYVRLFSLFGETWLRNDYTYTAYTGDPGPVAAQMQSPIPGSTFDGTTEIFTWNDCGADLYWIYVGTTGTGSYDVYNGNQGTNTEKSVIGLPNNGETLYVRLFSLMGETWYRNDYTYTAHTGDPGLAAAVIQGPAPGATFASTSETFVWNDSGAELYWLYVGTTGIGSYDVYNGKQGTNTSRTVSGLPSNGETVYVRLFSVIGGDWYRNDYTYTATGP